MYCDLLVKMCHDAENLDEQQIKLARFLIQKLFPIVPLQRSAISHSNVPFQRLVINETVVKTNSRLKSLSNLRYPPLEIEKELPYNRASLAGQSIFYCGSRGRLQVAVETLPKRGQLITESSWIVKPDSQLIVLALYQDREIALYNPNELMADYNNYLNLLSKLKTNARKVIEEIYKLIFLAFRRKVFPENRKGYLISSLISDFWLHHSSCEIDGIYYPSVPNNCSVMNLAVKPKVVDSKLQMIEAKEAIVLNDPSYSRGWMLQRTGTCSVYDENTNDLKWKNAPIPEGNEVYKVMKEFKINID